MLGSRLHTVINEQLARNDRQDYPRWMSGVVEDSLRGPLEIAFLEQRAAGVQIAIVMRKVAA